LLALVAVAALSPMAPVSYQDGSRICLSEALLHGRLSDDACFAATSDRASYGGHLYSDKAPGLSVLETPAVAMLQPGSPRGWSQDDLRLWGVRVLSVGLALLLCAFMVGRVSEGLAPGFGGIALVSFALGTLVAPLAGVSFESVPAAALAFGVFLLAWSRRPGLAGLLGGAALLVEYQSGLILVVIGSYVALRGLRPLLAFLAGLVPGALLLCAYDWAAFGAPWHLSYRYVANIWAGAQETGFFGIGVPHRFGIVEVFAGRSGLLVASPVLVLAAFGLVWLGRTHRAEAVVAATVTATFVLINCGYFDPYGGGSPGPRFLVAALPFLALGLGPAYSERPRLTLVLAVLSVIATTSLTLAWAVGGSARNGIWGELARVPVELGSAQFVKKLSPNVLSVGGLGPVWGALLVASCATGAFVVAFRGMPWAKIRAKRRDASEWRRSSLRAFLAAGVCAYLVFAAQVLALTDYPYGPDPLEAVKFPLVVLHTELSASSHESLPGGQVNFEISVTDRGAVGAGDLFLTVELSPGMRLVGPPEATLGPGCRGSVTVVCNLVSVRPKSGNTAIVRLGVQITQPTDQTLTAWASAVGDPQSNRASFTVSVGG
jgi:hypothetical protein